MLRIKLKIIGVPETPLIQIPTTIAVNLKDPQKRAAKQMVIIIIIRSIINIASLETCTRYQACCCHVYTDLIILCLENSADYPPKEFQR